jgi:hypothetical protein
MVITTTTITTLQRTDVTAKNRDDLIAIRGKLLNSILLPAMLKVRTLLPPPPLYPPHYPLLPLPLGPALKQQQLRNQDQEDKA